MSRRVSVHYKIGKMNEITHLELCEVDFRYGNGPALLAGLDWRIGRGETWALLGPSGCGKTTLLYLLAGMRRPQRGAVRFDGEALHRPCREIGLVLQDFGLLPWLSAAENVSLGMRLRGLPRKERTSRRDFWLERLGLMEVAAHFPGQLSGGQRQRVALARLLALQTEVLLLDEPFASVDELTRERLQGVLGRLVAELGATQVLVTHSVEEAALLAERVALILEPPPIAQLTLLENPCWRGGGELPAREDPAYFAFCREIRKLLMT